MPKLIASKYNPSLLLLIYIKDSLLQLRLHYHDWTLSKAQLYVQVSCDIEEIEPHHCGQKGLSMKSTLNNKCKRPAADSWLLTGVQLLLLVDVRLYRQTHPVLLVVDCPVVMSDALW